MDRSDEHGQEPTLLYYILEMLFNTTKFDLYEIDASTEKAKTDVLTMYLNIAYHQHEIMNFIYLILCDRNKSHKFWEKVISYTFNFKYHSFELKNYIVMPRLHQTQKSFFHCVFQLMLYQDQSIHDHESEAMCTQFKHSETAKKYANLHQAFKTKLNTVIDFVKRGAVEARANRPLTERQKKQKELDEINRKWKASANAAKMMMPRNKRILPSPTQPSYMTHPHNPGPFGNHNNHNHNHNHNHNGREVIDLISQVPGDSPSPMPFERRISRSLPSPRTFAHGNPKEKKKKEIQIQSEDITPQMREELETYLENMIEEDKFVLLSSSENHTQWASLQHERAKMITNILKLMWMMVERMSKEQVRNSLLHWEFEVMHLLDRYRDEDDIARLLYHEFNSEKRINIFEDKYDDNFGFDQEQLNESLSNGSMSNYGNDTDHAIEIDEDDDDEYNDEDDVSSDAFD